MNWIDDLLVSLITAQSKLDSSSHFPFNYLKLEPHIGVEWWKKVISSAKIVSEPTSKIELACAIPSARTFAIELDLFLERAKLHGIPKPQRLFLTRFFYDLLKTKIKSNDTFSLNGRKILLNWEEQNLVVQEIKSIKMQENLRRPFGNLLMALDYYVWSLYTDYFPSAGLEISGPYLYKNKFWFIRDFFDLNPKILWDDFHFKYKKIFICTLHNEKSIKIDLYNHFTSKKPMLNSITGYALIVDGERMETKEKIENIQQYFLLQAKDLYEKKWKKLGFEGQKEKFVFCHAYMLKPLFDASGQNWQPGKKILKNLRGKPLINYKSTPKQFMGEKRFNYRKKFLDPRISFYNKNLLLGPEKISSQLSE